MKGKLLKNLREALFPENYTCEICGVEIFGDGRLCPACAKKVAANLGDTCPVCGRRTKRSEICLECKASAPLYDKAVSAFVYGDGTALLIQRFKRGNPYLKRFFAPPLAQKCGIFGDADAICYIPMTDSAEKSRGYNQARLLAEELSSLLSLPLLEGALTKRRDTAEQKSLNLKERTENLSGCFRADKCVAGRKLILVDDVMTTGATANVAALALKRRGALKVFVATAASVEYKDKTLGVSDPITNSL